MDRRTFLQASGIAIAALAAAPVVLAIEEVVSATPERDKFWKYREALKKFDLMVGASYNPDLSVMHDRWDALFEHIFEHFEMPTEETFAQTKAAVDLILNRREHQEIRLRDVPPKVCEAAWPVLVARAALRDYQLPIYHRQLKTWKQFHKIYGDLIIG